MFRSARIKLTAWYLLIIMCVSLLFSFIIFKVESNEIDRFERIQRLRIERRLNQFQPPPFQIPTNNPELLEETKQRLLIMLAVINLGILFISGGLGYVLAGRTLKPIKEMMDEQNRFISDASHELRTPLTSLKSAFEVYLRNKQPTIPESKTLVKESINEVNKLQSLSDSLLQLAQYQTPNGNAKLEKLSVPQVIKEAIHKITPIAKQKEITIEYTPIEIIIKGNKYGLIDAIIILLDNAVKYSPDKSKVTVKTETVKNFVLISVKDNGIGINEKDLPNIFDRFYRADITRSKSHIAGYGLGLSIAKKIVDLYHGSISVKSKLGKGSNFTVRLPLFS